MQQDTKATALDWESRIIAPFGSLSLTEITDLPDSIGNLKLLKVINLGGTEISHLPKAVGRIGNLEKLLASWRLYLREKSQVKYLDYPS